MAKQTKELSAEGKVFNQILKTQEDYMAVVEFFNRFAEILVSLSAPVMAEKMGDGGDDDVPHIGWWTTGTSVTFTVYGPDQRTTMRVLRKAIGGQWKKSAYSETFNLNRYWTPWEDDEGTTPPRVYISIQGERAEVCQRVVTGTKEVHHDAVEAQPARTEVVEEVEWVCGNLLDD